MDDAPDKLCLNGVLEPKHQHLETKRLTHIPYMPHEFQLKWIRFILSHVHNGQLWLEQLVLITKKMIHWITGLPMLPKAKMSKTLGRAELEKKTLVERDNKGMNISSVSSTELKFGIHIIVHKI